MTQEPTSAGGDEPVAEDSTVPEEGQASAAEAADAQGPDAQGPGASSAGQPAADAAPDPGLDPAAELKAQLDERTADLQRLQAEFVNYKRRVERDRELVRQNATYAALTPIIEVLDAIDRAREHGPLDDGFQKVAEQLERAVAGVGLTRFGAVGDPFDPNLHDALSHIGEDPEVEVTTCKVVAKSGYKIGDRVVRAAQVLVVDPAPRTGQEPTDAGSDAGSDTGSDAGSDTGSDLGPEAAAEGEQAPQTEQPTAEGQDEARPEEASGDEND